MNYKVERKPATTGGWYEVMLSPFKTFDEAISYVDKYRMFYPKEDQNYKITYRDQSGLVPERKDSGASY